ncbi:hypothetical protein E2C01_042050 [Portunus trituberculatus]|uniref:Uncharacterized protein n=1 Tax=Portunus trituberculatus TaxID=210409 RepID=A0A5B7FP58_PORTR|nr:hypothetical protein [Portunus trituberculatus]
MGKAVRVAFPSRKLLRVYINIPVVTSLEKRRLGSSCDADDATAPDSVNIRLAGQEVPPSSCSAGFSGFTPAEHCISSDYSDSQDGVQPDSVLPQCARSYGPVDEVSAGIDKHVADMVNHVFDNGLREEEYKQILDDIATGRLSCFGTGGL